MDTFKVTEAESLGVLAKRIKSSTESPKRQTYESVSRKIYLSEEDMSL